MKIKLSDHFTVGRLLRFTLPSIVMMIFTSIYGVVDGFFVSNYVGKTPFAAVNFIMPFLMMLGTAGFMFGTGGSALVAKTLGEGDKDKANKLFSLIIYSALAVGTTLMVIGYAVLRPVSRLLGAEGALLEDCITYGKYILIAIPAFVLQMAFQSFFVAAEKPQLGLLVTVISGVTNMVLDALLVAVFPLGLIGAALATSLSQYAGAVFPMIYFARKNTSLLRLTKAEFDGKALLKTCTNGSSELMSNISMSLVNMLYNIQLLKYAGENGVAAYGVMMYVNLVFLAAFIGYSIGTAPIISYHFGAQNHTELKGLLKRSTGIIAVFSILMAVSAFLLSSPLSSIFVGYDDKLMELTVHGFRLFSFSFLFAGLAIFSSGFFTALNDGLTSALISFMRTLIFETAAVMLLPTLLGIDGIWLSVSVAELAAVLVGTAFIIAKRKKYKYF